jgi:MFS family permease
MITVIDTDTGKKQSIRALEATNFFLADVQTGLGPFLAAYLAGAGWQPGRVGMALTLGGIITVVLQVPAGAIVDQVRSKRLILILAAAVLAFGAVLLSITAAPWAVYTSQVLIGGAGPFLGPTLAAVTMGMVGVTLFDRQFGKNQSFNSAGNVACALLIAGMSHIFGNRAIFITAAVLTIPTVLSVRAIKSKDIDYDLARGGAIQIDGKEVAPRRQGPADLSRLRVPFSLRQCSHAAAAWRNALARLASISRSLYVGLHHRHAGGHHVLRLGHRTVR